MAFSCVVRADGTHRPGSLVPDDPRAKPMQLHGFIAAPAAQYGGAMSVTPRLIDPGFWQLPLEERMAHFAELREDDPFASLGFDNPLTGETETFHAVTRLADVV